MFGDNLIVVGLITFLHPTTCQDARHVIDPYQRDKIYSASFWLQILVEEPEHQRAQIALLRL